MEGYVQNKINEEIVRRDLMLNPVVVLKIVYPFKGDINTIGINGSARKKGKYHLMGRTLEWKASTVTEAVMQGITEDCKTLGRVVVDITDVAGGQNWQDLDAAIKALQLERVVIKGGVDDLVAKEKRNYNTFTL